MIKDDGVIAILSAETGVTSKLGFPCAKTFFINIRKIWLILLKIDLNNHNKYVYMFIIKKLAFEKKFCVKMRKMRIIL